MCSVEDDFTPEDIKSVESCKKVDLICKKCAKEVAMVRLQKKHSYCRRCFLSMVNHKFRSTLGKTKIIKRHDRVLVVSIGNESSNALLHLIKAGMDERTHKQIIFHPMVLFIDESILWPKEMRIKELPNIMKTLKCSRFECYIVKLSSVYDDCSFKNIIQGENVDDYLKENENDRKLFSLFRKIGNSTSKIDFLLKLRYQLQMKTAKLLSCSKVFTSECGTSLSIRLLSNVSLGRGSQIPFEVAVCDKRISDVYCIRPLREITSKEIMFYNVFNKVESFVVPSVFFMFECNAISSLQHETESFVYQLQEEFPSTVYTIFHTGDKLKLSDFSDEVNTCLWCCNPLPSCTPLILCEKQNGPSAIAKSDTDMGCNNCVCKRKIESADEIIRLKKVLCYGCQHILSDMESLEYLPNGIMNEMKLKLRANELRKKIEDFLL